MNKTIVCLFISGLLFNGLFAIAVPVATSLDSAQQATYHVLLVVSSYGKETGKKRPGYEFDEFSQAYLVFKSNDLRVDIASPKGGPVEPDEFDKEKPYNKIVLEDGEAMAKLANTLPTASINGSDYDALFIVGGKGALFDLPHDPALQDLIASMYQTGGVVAAVCHGPAALVHVTLDNGQYLIDDRSISGFTNEEEALFGNRWKDEYPFSLEHKLNERGAFLERSEPMLPQVTTSGKLITGQNSYSTLGVAEATIRFLGEQPVERTLYPDERSMALLKRWVAGQREWAEEALRSDTSKFDIELIAIYGHYRLLSARDERKIRLAIGIIELATPYIYNPILQLTHAEGYLRLGDQATAKELLTDLVAKEPDLEEARQLLETF